MSKGVSYDDEHQVFKALSYAEEEEDAIDCRVVIGHRRSNENEIVSAGGKYFLLK